MLFSSSYQSYAQDATFSQYFNHPLYVNPSLAGISYGPRFGINARSQWPGLVDGIGSGYLTASLSYDQHIERLHSGIGLLLTTDRTAGNLLVDNSVELAYSYQIRFKDHHSAMKFGISGSYFNRYLNWENLRFADQVDPIYGFFDAANNLNPTSEDNPLKSSLHRGDMHFGAMYYGKRFYGGIAFRHLLSPKISFWADPEGRLPLKAVIHSGMMFPLKKGDKKMRNYIAPNILLEMQKNHFQLNLGAYFNVQYIYGGLFYRNNILSQDAVILVAGLRKGFFNLGYSYDISLSRLNKGGGGSHELSLIFNLSKTDNSVNPNNRKGILICPEILNF